MGLEDIKFYKELDNNMVEYCSMCGEELQQYEENEGICRNCLSILPNNDIDLF